MGCPKAITATAHKLARIVYHLVRYGLAYVKRDEAAYAEQVRERLERAFHRRAKELGYEVRKVEPKVEASAFFQRPTQLSIRSRFSRASSRLSQVKLNVWR